MAKRLALVVVAVAFLMPAAAEARARPHLLPLLDEAPFSTSFKDAVIPSARHGSPLAHASATVNFSAFPTSEGYSVGVAVSPAYVTPDPTIEQTYVKFLDGLPHSTELQDLGVYIAPADEVMSLCGGQSGTLACYDAGSQVMVVPGQQTDVAADGLTTSYVITHEYGHHIANHRADAPFDAFSMGPKYWSSYELVCNRSAQGLLVPGNEGESYDLNPGESWAETYAHMVYRDVRWQLTPLLQPDDGSFAAAAKDISDLWHANRVTTFHGSFRRGGTSTKRFQFPLSLDGSLSVRLSGPRKSNYNLAIASENGEQGRTHAAGSRDSLSFKAACRTQQVDTVTVTVTRVRGAGPFSVRVDYAG